VDARPCHCKTAGVEHRWPEAFTDLRSGIGCPMCERTEQDLSPFGARFFVGDWADAVLGRHPVRTGYAFVVWKGRHVAEPHELAPDEAAGFWSEVAQVARAVEERYEPTKMNWLHLGNGVPHLHVHLVPRPFDDPNAGGPVEAADFEQSRVVPLSDDVLLAEAAALRRGLVS
jgi:diadenosine tetraphosphate (Ap4A) HIT family hydrolase